MTLQIVSEPRLTSGSPTSSLQGRRRKRAIRQVSRACIVVVATLLTSCGDRQNQFYVVVPVERDGRFLPDLSEGLRRQGYEMASADMSFTPVDDLHVLEARRFGRRVWSQNMPLDGDEDLQLCGFQQRLLMDPRQYVVVSYYNPLLTSEGEALRQIAVLRTEMSRRGYSVRDQPVTCSGLDGNAARQ